MNWYYAQNNQQKGPVSEDELRQLLESGALSMESLVWYKGLPRWTAAKELPNFKKASVEWYYVLNGAQQGPVSEDELKASLQSGRLPASSDVWCEQMDDWISANQLPLFAALIPKAPPVVSSPPPPPRPASAGVSNPPPRPQSAGPVSTPPPRLEPVGAPPTREDFDKMFGDKPPRVLDQASSSSSGSGNMMIVLLLVFLILGGGIFFVATQVEPVPSMIRTLLGKDIVASSEKNNGSIKVDTSGKVTYSDSNASKSSQIQATPSSSFPSAPPLGPNSNQKNAAISGANSKENWIPPNPPSVATKQPPDQLFAKFEALPGEPVLVDDAPWKKKTAEPNLDAFNNLQRSPNPNSTDRGARI